MLAAAMSLFHVYAAFFVVPPETLRAVQRRAALFLIFLLYPVARRFRHRLAPWDVVLALAAAGTIAYLLLGGEDLRRPPIAAKPDRHGRRRGVPAAGARGVRR
ncbi:MAG: hypothetical protein HC861_12105, partial [Rhodospirillaceae bacterium]|nr:hypothetical protein [Rhodospirillaceae bacterium]